MIKRKLTSVFILSAILSLTIGGYTPNLIAHATSKQQVSYSILDKETTSLVLHQKNGSNEIALAFEVRKDYDKSITSFELCIQLEPSQITGVNLTWNKALTSNQCRYLYDQKTGELRIYVVDSKDLLEDRKINIGNMTIVSNANSAFNSTVVLQEVKTVDLQHQSDVLTVNRDSQTIVYTPTSTPINPPSTQTPSTSVTPNITPTTTPTPSLIKVQEISLNKTKATLEVGKTLSLTTTVLPWNASNPSVTWSSDNEKVAKVSANGKVTAIGKGTAKITARSKDGSKVSSSAVITVKAKTVKATKVKLSKSSLALKPKASTTLKATVSPSNVTNSSIVWWSSNPKVATVKNGKITAKAVGTATIYAKTRDGSNLKVACKVTVSNIKLNKTRATLKKGKSLTLKATVTGKNKKVTWKSSDSSIATVSSTGKVTAKKAGTATITAKANGVTATFQIVVK